MSANQLSLRLLLCIALVGCGQRDREVKLPQGCIDCHEEDRKRAEFPLHTTEGFPTDCAQCHTQVEWKPASFDHREFPLTGAHSWASCASCHQKEPVPKTCIGCHDADRRKPKKPDHLADGFSTTCENCHTNDAWKPAAFDHGAAPFVGGHASVACGKCHEQGKDRSEAKGKTCFDCHEKDRATAKPPAPDHLAASFPTDCTKCHTVFGFTGVRYSHDEFRLTGKHSTTDCADCHKQDPMPKSCIGCHNEDRKTPKAPQPDHLAETFSQKCADCHSSNGWTPAALDHSKFPLTDGHSGIDCASCHQDKNDPQKPIATTCVGCHEADRKTSKLFDHLADGFPTDCTDCHSVIRWKPATFDHSDYPLQGGHQGVACSSCHDPEPVPTLCVGCHQDDRKDAKPPAPDHLAATFSTACESCHTINAWKPATLDHSKFPLTNGHSNVDCAKCHTDPQKPEVAKGNTCAQCHEADRKTPKPPAPDHFSAGFPTNCADCHSTVKWTDATFAHDKFRLTGKHTTALCADCHAKDPLPTTCIGCHDADRKTPKAPQPDHLATTFSQKCSDCHTTAGWTPVALDHSRFPLTGGHSSVDCAQCHKDSTQPEKPVATTCVGCHDADRKTPTNPNHLALGFPIDCTDCHTAVRWKPATFDHDAFPLQGGHLAVACASCHDPEPVPTTCLGCHDADRQTPKAPQPDHLATSFSKTCDSCHTVSGWKPAALDHSKFPLTGGHSAADCAACHLDAQNPAQPKGNTCAQCHDADRKTPKPPAPDHLSAGFPADCADCHSTSKWTDTTFAHDKFRLTGKHTTALCADCHNRAPLPTTCVGCHDADRRTPKAPQPDHLAATFSQKCSDCHTTAGWTPVALDHSRFPLTGGHSSVDCAQCHKDSTQPEKPVATTCVGCHDADRKTPTNPSHLAVGFPTDCTDCHTTVRWKPASFQHDAFPLQGGHLAVACASCHDPEPVPKTCVGCHDADRQTPKAPQPDHLAASFSKTCDGCHTISGWKPAALDHSRFPLTGGHSTVDCAGCHTNPQKPEEPRGTTCAGCHDGDRSKALPPAPDHLQASFPPNCENCHTTNGWRGAVVDHSVFPLSGKHTTAACSSCHSLSPLPTTCFGCHDQDRRTPKAPQPDHLAGTFSTLCSDCHTTSGWTPASLNHDAFPLTNGHSNVACATCHTDPQNPDVPKGTTCAQCHSTDARNVTLPDHGSAGFPTDCMACHTTQRWKPANFDHETYFPINKGPHSGETCATCHTDPQNAKVFSCFASCHKHSQAKMDDKHKEENGYSYTSAACLKCHPRGKKE